MPHLFLADVERWCETAALNGIVHEVDHMLAALEDEFAHGDDEVQELITVSFLEHLPAPATPRRFGTDWDGTWPRS